MAAPGRAQTTRPRLRYGGDAAFAPFESLDAQGRAQGFQVELLAELGAAAGVDFDIVLKPWPQTEADFRQGRNDVVAMVDTTQRRQWALFTRGHATPALALYHRHDRPAPQGLHDLVGLRLAVPDGEAMRDTLATWLAGMRGPFVRRQGADQVLAAVQDGQADVALLPRAYADPLLAAGHAPDLRAAHLNLGLQTYALAVAPGRQALQAQLQRGLDELEASGRLEALRMRWLSSHRDLAERGLLQRDLSQQRHWTWAAAGTGAVAATLLGAWLWQRGRRMAAEHRLRVQAETELERAQALLEQAFTRNTDAMLLVERGSQQLRDANPALQTLLGQPLPQLLGQRLPDLGRHLDAGTLQQLAQALADGDGVDALPLQLRHADGSPRHCLLNADTLLIDRVPHVFCIVRDITAELARSDDLQRAYQSLQLQLQAAQAGLAAAQQAQGQATEQLQAFTRAVSHDLKTPLNAVQGFAGLLNQRLKSGHAQEAQAYGEHIERAAQRMDAMINALTRLSQLGRQPLQRSTVNMQRLAQDTAELLQAGQPGLRCELRIGALPAAQGDTDLVAQVWQNLLGNALKYSAKVAEPKVRVDSHRDERGTWYRITDNGAGFDMARAQALFVPFQRLHTAAQFEGTGVGLSLVRRIVDHHGGDVRLRSAPGVGTVAEFTLDPPPP